MTSTLIIGGGLAGLFAALKLAPAPVTILSPRPLGEGASSAWAQGGIAAAIGEGDSIASHVADTIVAGAGLVDEAITRGMAEEAGGRIADLLAFGVPFDRDLAGKLVQSREAAHSAKRIVRVRGDMAGAAIMAALVAAVRATPSIRVLEGAEAERLIVSKGRVAGARARISGPGGMRRVDLRAGATVLATGGIGQLYALTTNPAEARGEGLAIAAEAGAVVENAEFVQFHPTAIAIGRDPAPLATEALRGEGATLINSAGARFMPALHKDGELAPRDIVARGVFAEIVAGRGAFLDCRHLGGHFAALFPTVHATCLSAGIDPATQPIPIAPAEHYHMGGVKTDARGATSLPGLFAAGEVASTGVHGANRLASNSLLEAVVFAARIAADLAPVTTDPVAISDLGPAPAEPDEGPAILDLRHAMTRHVGVVREAAGLEAAVAAARRAARDALSGRRRRMAEVALIIAAGALARAESRGGHFRNDYPKADAIGRPSLAEPLVTLLGDEETAADAAAPAPARPLAAPPHLPENCR